MGFFKDRSDYFKNLATLNKQVQHDGFITGTEGPKRKSFFRLNNEEELLAACTNWAHFPCLVHFGYAGRYTENPNEVKKRSLLNDLLFLAKAIGPADMQSIQDAKDLAFRVMEEFIKKMCIEFEELGYCSNFNYIDMGMFSFSEYGPVNSTLYGWRLTFNDETFPTEHDPDNWFET